MSHRFDRSVFEEGDEVWAPHEAANQVRKAIVISSDPVTRMANVQFVRETTKAILPFEHLEHFGRIS